MVQHIDIVGAPIAVVDYQRTMDVMDALIARRERGYVAATAVHAVMVGREDPEMAAALAGATLVVPDGMPLVWAANRLGAKLRDRVYGPELMARYCERAAANGYRMWLYGGYDDAALDLLIEKLKERFPGIVIAGRHAPPQGPQRSAATLEIAEAINADRPDIVWVGLGAPYQEKWMAAMRPLLEAPVLVGVGAAFDFLAGRKRQAPARMQRYGLEWLYRLLQEPRRLLGRYLVYNTRFVMAFANQICRERHRTH